MPHDGDRAILDLVRARGVLRPRDLAPSRISRWRLSRLVEQGSLVRTGRGLYTLAGAEVSGNHSLVEAARRVPGGVVCLLSALRFHEVTTQNPGQVWLAIAPSARRPRVDHPPLRIARFSGPARSEGIERHEIEGTPVPVYSVAKTVADCFKYRGKIGVDVAVEALRETSRHRLASLDDIWRFAQICRVANIMRPYLDSLE